MLENFLLESNSHTQYKNLNKLHVDQYQHNQHIRIMQNITAEVTHNKDTFTYKFYSSVFVGQLTSRERQTKLKKNCFILLVFEDANKNAQRCEDFNVVEKM
jgi:hypothetical protein